MTLRGLVGVVSNIYRDAAKACIGRLVCQKCGHTEPCDEDRAALYLRVGWPKCCGLTMRLEIDEVAS